MPPGRKLCTFLWPRHYGDSAGVVAGAGWLELYLRWFKNVLDALTRVKGKNKTWFLASLVYQNVCQFNLVGQFPCSTL
jgi:hypothetical protein